MCVCEREKRVKEEEDRDQQLMNGVDPRSHCTGAPLPPLLFTVCPFSVSLMLFKFLFLPSCAKPLK